MSHNDYIVQLRLSHNGQYVACNGCLFYEDDTDDCMLGAGINKHAYRCGRSSTFKLVHRLTQHIAEPEELVKIAEALCQDQNTSG